MKRGRIRKYSSAFKIVIDRRTGSVDDVFLDCESESFFIFIECNQLIIGEVCADRLCDRTADKSEPDKADFCRSDV